TAVTGLLVWSYARHRRRWMEERLDLTQDLVQKMVGHRTRLAQQDRAQWHAGEDQALEQYLGTSRQLDRMGIAAPGGGPRGGCLLGLLGLAPTFVAGDSSTNLAVAVGGIVLAYRALRNLGEGLDRLTAVALAWERVRPFWKAAEQDEAIGHPALVVPAQRSAE